MKLYYNPLSTYCQKVLLAFYEKDIEFEKEVINLMDPIASEQYREIYPIGKVPLLELTDGDKIPESTIIIEFLEGHFPQRTRLIPEAMDQARQTRFIDRMCDLYLNNSVGTLVFASEKLENDINNAKKTIKLAFQHLNERLRDRRWLMGEEFTMADCACIPPLLYAQKLAPFDNFKNVIDYYDRARARISYQHVLEEVFPILEKSALFNRE